jgi:ATP-dependent Clp protease ATP-binding subunit ClpA
MRLGLNFIGTEHLLLGLLAESRGITATVLSNLGIDTGRVRREVLNRVEGGTRSSVERDLGTLDWAREALRRSFGRYPRPGGRASFERFTGPARKVVVLAQDEARRFNHNYIGTEHLLLGLIQEEKGIAARALGTLGVDLDQDREQVESIVGYGEEGTGAQAPFTLRTIKVLELALREALQLGHDYVGTEHVLLGLAGESEGVAARVLLNLDVDPDAVRREVIKKLPDAGDALDPFDEAEREMEELEHRTLFRGRVGGIRAEVDLPRPVTVAADADYANRTQAEPSRGTTAVEPGTVVDQMRAGLQEADARGLEAVVAALGGRLLGAFPAMLEVTVTVSGAPEPADPPGTTFSVSATFRR